jgi:hypothetical protein
MALGDKPRTLLLTAKQASWLVRRASASSSKQQAFADPCNNYMFTSITAGRVFPCTQRPFGDLVEKQGRHGAI